MNTIKQYWEKSSSHFKATVGIILIVFFLFIIYSIGWRKSQGVNQGMFVSVRPMREVTKYRIKYVAAQVEKGQVMVLDKPELVKHVKGLPEYFTSNPKIQATSTGIIGPYEGETDVLNFLDMGTGLSQLYAKQRPLPLLGFEDKGELGGRIGVSDLGKEADVYAQKTLTRIGGFHIGGYLEGSYRPDEKDHQLGGKAMILINHKW